MKFFLLSINKLRALLSLSLLACMVLFSPALIAQMVDVPSFDSPPPINAQPLYGESCDTQKTSLEKLISNAGICEKNSDCVEVHYNMDGCNCASFANKHKYIRSIEKKTQRYYENCEKPYLLTQPTCSCQEAVTHECSWGKCIPIRCDFRETYPRGTCTCPVGGVAKYDAIRHPDGTIEETIYCEPKSFMLKFPDDKK